MSHHPNPGSGCEVTDAVEGSEKVVRGPRLLFLGVYEIVSSKGAGLTLTETDYVFIQDKLTGSERVVNGTLHVVSRGHRVW